MNAIFLAVTNGDEFGAVLGKVMIIMLCSGGVVLYRYFKDKKDPPASG